MFLRDEFKLELSQSKTLITHAASQAAHFLGYEIRAQHSDTKITRGRVRVTRIAPVSCGMIENFVAQHWLGLPKSYQEPADVL